MWCEQATWDWSRSNLIFIFLIDCTHPHINIICKDTFYNRSHGNWSIGFKDMGPPRVEKTIGKNKEFSALLAVPWNKYLWDLSYFLFLLVLGRNLLLQFYRSVILQEKCQCYHGPQFTRFIGPKNFNKSVLFNRVML